MSAVAKLLKDTGVTVNGSDEEVYSPISDFLEHEGLTYKTPYNAANIPADTDIIVIGKNAKLIRESNTEVAAAFASGKPVLSFPEILGELSKDKETIVVAGSYGKSTSAALLAHCLKNAGLDPSYFIGAVPLTPNTSAKIGKGNFFVLEGDEYPSSNTDPRAKFLHFHPSHLLITPLAHDHFNVFPTPESYLKPFEELVSITSGTIVACVEGPVSKQLLNKIPNPVTYGLTEGVYRAADIAWGEKTHFSILQNDRMITRVETALLGKHNVQNIVGVAALLFSLNAITPEQFAKAVQSFKGIKRRLDKKSEKTSIPMYEGFGSSYEKAKSAIAAIKLHYPTKRLVIVFEPHTFSWRNRASLPWYDTVFEGASKVFIYEPAEQGASTHAQLTQREIIEKTKTAGFDVEPLYAPDISLTQNDVVLFLTSGNLGGFIEPIIALAEQKFPA